MDITIWGWHDRYIVLADEHKLVPSGLSAQIYLATIAHFSCGEFGQALNLFVRLNRDFPDYKREQYIGDDYPPDPQSSVPMQASVAKSILL